MKNTNGRHLAMWDHSLKFVVSRAAFTSFGVIISRFMYANQPKGGTRILHNKSKLGFKTTSSIFASFCTFQLASLRQLAIQM